MAPKLYLVKVSPPCRTVQMVAKAIGLELEIEEVELEDLRQEEMLALNPQHTVPILVDSDEDFTIWDSHAIAIYLVGQYAEDDSLYPKNDVKQRAVINQRLHYDNILSEKTKNAFFPVLMGVEDEITDDARDGLLETLGILEIFLKDNIWVAGDTITIADLSILAWICTVESIVFVIDPERFPRLVDWLDRAKNLPYFEECNREALDMFKSMFNRELPLL